MRVWQSIIIPVTSSHFFAQASCDADNKFETWSMWIFY